MEVSTMVFECGAGANGYQKYASQRKNQEYGLGRLAARAHDGAAITIKGHAAILNFPKLAHQFPKPKSNSPRDIQDAAHKAAYLDESSYSELHDNDYTNMTNDDAFLDLPDLFIDHFFNTLPVDKITDQFWPEETMPFSISIILETQI